MNMAAIVCPRCRTDVRWPAHLSAAEKVSFADATRANRLQGTRFAVDHFNMELRDAKSLAFHVSASGKRCHRCGHALEGEASLCSHCKSANLDW